MDYTEYREKLGKCVDAMINEAIEENELGSDLINIIFIREICDRGSRIGFLVLGGTLSSLSDYQ